MKTSPGYPNIDPFEATVVEYDNAPDECTISPRNASEDRQTTAWITAEEDSFCAVVEMR